MANVAAPFGFKRWQAVGATPVNMGFTSGQRVYGTTTVAGYRIASGYGTAIFFGDLVRMNSSLTGYVEQWANGDGGTATKIPIGIFVGCEYFSTSQQRTIFNNYWPGSDATGDVIAKIVDDPDALFMCQAGSSVTINDTNIGQSADIVSGSGANGNTTTGISAMSLNTPTTTTTLPFKVVALVVSPPLINGTDYTTAANNVIVAFNNQMFKNTTGI